MLVAGSKVQCRRPTSKTLSTLERLRELREATDDVERTPGERVASDRAIDWVRASSATWPEADVPPTRYRGLGPPEVCRTSGVLGTAPRADGWKRSADQIGLTLGQ